MFLTYTLRTIVTIGPKSTVSVPHVQKPACHCEQWHVLKRVAPPSHMIFTCHCIVWIPLEPSSSFLSPAVICSTPQPGPQTLCLRSQRRPVLTPETASPPGRPSAQTPASLWNWDEAEKFDTVWYFSKSISHIVSPVIAFWRKKTHCFALQKTVKTKLLQCRNINNICIPVSQNDKKPLALSFCEQILSQLCTCLAEFPPSQPCKQKTNQQTWETELHVCLIFILFEANIRFK